LVSGATADKFDVMVVGEIVEEHNQSFDWFEALPLAKQHQLYSRQLAKPPRRSKP
jgi:hypothetical protein